jgi:general stress protein YciG
MNNNNDDNRSQGSQHDNTNGSDQNRSDQRSTSGNQHNQQRNPNAGNFANDPERAREAGRKGGLA